MTIVLDTPARIARSFAIIGELTAEHGLLTSEMVPALRALSATESPVGCGWPTTSSEGCENACVSDLGLRRRAR